jgi:hypothetical protein
VDKPSPVHLGISLGYRRAFINEALRSHGAPSIRRLVVLALVGLLSFSASPAAAEDNCPEGVIQTYVHEGILYGIRCEAVGVNPDGSLKCEWVLIFQSGWPVSNSRFSRGVLYASSSLNLVVSGTLSLISGGTDFGGGWTGSHLFNGGAKTQPAGEIRIRARTERWNGSTWVSCLDTGYTYNPSSAFHMLDVANMGTSPDCGAGLYRAFSWHHVYEGGAWRGGTRTTSSLPL